MKRAGKALKRTAWAGAAVVAGLVVLVFLALAWLQTERGERAVQRRLLEAAASELAGQVELGDLDLEPGGVIVLENARLLDPDGAVVARVGRLVLKADLRQLIHRRVEIDRARASDVELFLEQGPKGLNLARAVELRKPSAQPRPPGAAPSPWSVVLEKLQVERGRVRYTPSAGKPPLVDVTGLGLDAKGRFVAGRLDLVASALADRAAPLDGRLSIELKASGGVGAGIRGEPLTVERLAMTAGKSRLLAKGVVRGEAIDATIEDLLVHAPDLAAFVPESPVQADLAATGTFALADGRLSTKLAARSDAGAADLSGSARFSPFEAEVHADAKELDLGALLRELPTTTLNGSARGRFGPGPTARFDVTLAPSAFRRLPIRSLEATIDTDWDVYRIDSFAAQLPGGHVRANGTASAEELALDLALTAAEVAPLSSAVARALDATPPALAGKGRLRARVEGPPAAPRVTVDGTFDRLEAGPAFAEGLTLHSQLLDASRPWLVQGMVSAQRGRVGEMPFARLEARVDANRRSFVADLSTKGLAGVSVRLDGEIAPGFEAVSLRTAFLSTNGARWSTVAPARIALTDGFWIDDLQLVAGPQKIGVRGGLRRGQWSLDARLARIDLAQLPKVYLPPGWQLVGVVDGTLALTGPASRPRAQAKASLAGVGVPGYGGIEGTLEALLEGSERVSGTVALRRKETKFDGTFGWPLADAPAGSPVDLRVKLENESLGALAKLAELAATAEKPRARREGAEEPAAIAGTLSLVAELKGTRESPEASIDARVEKLRYGAVPELPLAVLRARSKDTTEAHLEVSLLGASPATADATAELPLRRLFAQPALTREELERLPMKLSVDAAAFPLDRFAGALLPAGTGGQATLTARLTGSAGAPRGRIGATVAAGRFDVLRDLDLDLEATLAAEHVRLRAAVQTAGESLAGLTASLGRGPEGLLSVAALGSAPVSAMARVGPLPLERVMPSARGAFAGGLSGELELSGTLDTPRVVAQGALADLTYEGQPIGRIDWNGGVAGRSLRAEARGAFAAGGSALLKATLGADLSIAALRRGLKPAEWPLEAALDAEGLNLKILELLSTQLRRASGQLTAHARVGGTVGAPSLRGDASVREGKLSPAGYGSFRDIALDLRVTDQLIEIPQLSLRAGSGSATLQARAERSNPAAAYRFSGQAKLDQLPITVDDRLVATLTGSTDRWAGSIQDSDMRFDLRLARLLVTLPELNGKELQPLGSHPDIAVVTGRERPRRAAAAVGGSGAAEARQQALELAVDLQAPTIIVESADARIDASAHVNLAYAGAEPVMSGEVRTRRGVVDVIGRKFELQPGGLHWKNDVPGNPRLELSALHENTREQVKVKVTITGTAEKPKLELSSEPPLDEAQIATLLATGRRELKRGSVGVTSGAQAASVVGSFAADRLRKTLSQKLPLDVLQVEVGDEGIEEAQVEAGTYVTDRVYIGYRKDFGADVAQGENTDEVRVEYQLTPRITIESQYGTAKGGADVVYTREY